MRYQGRITRWHDDRGFGYITPNGGGDELFVHVKALSGWRARPAGGEIVPYGNATDARGRPCAAAVRRVDLRPARRPAPSASPASGAGWLPAVFVVALVAAAALGRLPWFVPAACVAMSALTFVVYALDKSAARQGVSLAGGWPGALAAQRRLRHKSSKTSFRGVFWLTVVANVALVLWLASTPGAAVLGSLLRE